MSLFLIAAVARNGVIGANNALPWRLPDDLKRFRALTMGHTVVMGRRTFESLPGPLPGRDCVVLTRDRAGVPGPGVRYIHTLTEILDQARTRDVFIAGGANLYEQTIGLADRLYLTIVHAAVAGDAHFPPFAENAWDEIAAEHHEADARHIHAFTMRTLVHR
ncbi:MAG: dihydrofolate reductase [Gammaproteobacteria bacterium]|nr:dihydrofolate reductase [Gammaproteobacteria bacterium]